MTDLEAQIEIGLKLEQDEKDEEAIAHFVKLAEQYPNDPRVIFELGGAYDSAGYEAEAIPQYRRAIDLGLSGEFLPRVAVQLGSSLRNVGQYDEAAQVLRTACDQFPEHRALRMFLALALHSAGKSQVALVELLDLVLNIPDALEGYNRSLRYYTDELREPKM